MKDDRNDQKRSRGPKEVLRVAIDAIKNHLQTLLARLPISNVSRQIEKRSVAETRTIIRFFGIVKEGPSLIFVEVIPVFSYARIFATQDELFKSFVVNHRLEALLVGGDRRRHTKHPLIRIVDGYISAAVL